MGWLTALVAVVAGVLSALRLVSVKGWSRYAAAIELLMAVGMVLMSLPATASSFGQSGLWWAAVFGVAALGSTAAATRHALRHGWRHGVHWAHQVLASGVMVIMALMAVPASSAGAALALGLPSMAGMPGMDMGSHMDSMAGMEGHMGEHGHMSPHTAAGADSAWPVAFAALAVYFLLSMAASIWTWLRGERRSVAGAGGEGARPGRVVHRLLRTLDGVVGLLVFMTASLWTRAQSAGRAAAPLNAGAHRRRPGADASADAAFTAHLAMASSMSVMLLTMAS